MGNTSIDVSIASLQCTNYCAAMNGDPQRQSVWEWAGAKLWPDGNNPHPTTKDRDEDPRYVAGVMKDGMYYPADIAPGVDGDDYIEVKPPAAPILDSVSDRDFRASMWVGGGTWITCVDHVCQ